MERRFNRGFNDNRQSPVAVGEELNVRIEAVGEKGDGIAKKSGFVLFVPNTKAGDHVKIKVTKVLSKVGFAEVIGNADSAPSESHDHHHEHHHAPPQRHEDPKYEDSDSFGDEEEEEQ